MFIFWLIIFILIQVCGFNGINFLALLVILSAVRKGSLWGLILGGITGIGCGLFSNSVFGLNIAIYALLGLLCGLVREHFLDRKGFWDEILFSFCGLVVFYGVSYMFTNRFNIGVVFTVILTTVVSPVVFRVVK